MNQGLTRDQKCDELWNLVVWLKTKPAKKKYNYRDHERCLAAQYCAAIGRDYALWSKDCWFDVVLECIATFEPHTFGAALSRARCATALMGRGL
jgi:hypothetical protein